MASTSGRSAGAVTLLAQLSRIAIQLVSLILLSRILTPDDFGIFAIALVILGVGELVRDAGLTTASIQAKSLSQAEQSNLFWINSVIGLALTLVVGLTGAVIALSSPILGVVLAVSAISFAINATQAQAQVRLARDHRFFALAATDVSAQLVATTAGIASALAGHGVFALVVQFVASSLVLATLRVALARWRPAMYTSATRIGHLVRFGGALWLTQFLNYASNNITTIAIGAATSTSAVGYYNRASQMTVVPVAQVVNPLANVALPLLRRADQSSAANGLKMMSKIDAALGAFGAVIAGFFIPAAPMIVPLVLGPGWDASIPLAQVLAFGAMMQVISFGNYLRFVHLGLMRSFLIYNFCTKPASILLVVLGVYVGGVSGAVCMYAVGLFLSWPFALVLLFRKISRRVLPPLLIGASAITIAGLGSIVSYAISSISAPAALTLTLQMVFVTMAVGAILALSLKSIEEDSLVSNSHTEPRHRVLLRFYNEHNLGDDLLAWILASSIAADFVVVGKRLPASLVGLPNVSLESPRLRDIVLERLAQRLKLPIRNNFVIRHAAKRCDLMAYVGGSIFIERDATVNHWRGELKFYRALPIPYVILDANFGPYVSEGFPALVDNVLGGSAATVLRDQQSFDLFSEHNQVALGPDLAFGLETAGFPPQRHSSLLVSVMDLSKAGHPNAVGEYEQAIAARVSEVAGAGRDVTLIGFCASEGDEAAAIRIFSLLPESARRHTHVWIYDGDLQSALGFIANADEIIATRFHAVVLALAFEKHVLPIIYSSKTTQMLDDAGFCGERIELHSTNLKQTVLDARGSTIPPDSLINLKERSSIHLRTLQSVLSAIVPRTYNPEKVS